MARNSAGKWVARAGATGGSRTYRGQVPVNWYAALVVIVLLGILSVVYSNYEYRHPSAAATSTTPPTTGTTSYAGLAIDVCGKMQPPLASNAPSTKTKSSKSFYTSGSGVITIAPKTDAEAGKNALLGKFVAGYSGFALSATLLKVPSDTHKAPITYKAGQTCPKGTPDAGKKAYVLAEYWPSVFDTKAKPITVQGDPSTLKFSANQLITVGFVPAGSKLQRTPTVEEALIGASEGTTTAPTTTAPTTATTTAPTTTATTAPATTTTVKKSSSK